MQFNRLMVLVVASVLALSCSAHGLEELIAVPETSDEQKRVARQQYLDELISSIQSTCELTESESRRLQVASKGAVEYSFTDDVNEENAWRLEIKQGRWVSILDAAAAARHPIWTRTLERTLTREQLEKANTLAMQQLERWTQRFARQQFILGAGRNGALIRHGRARLPIIREVRPFDIEQVRRLDLIIQPPPRNR